MDKRLREVLELLVQNIHVLDDELMRLTRTEQFTATEQCMPLIEKIRDGCIGTLQNVQTLERKFQRSAFIIPEDMLPTLER